MDKTDDKNRKWKRGNQYISSKGVVTFFTMPIFEKYFQTGLLVHFRSGDTDSTDNAS